MNDRPDLLKWLPITRKEVELRGWDQLDVILITGDAYVDHPAFGAAVIGRLLEKAGYKIALIPQPNWQDDLRDFKKLGKPRLFFGITSGNMDSMVNHYTANKRLRSNDAYTPAGDAGFRPDYATSVYSRIIKQLFPDSLVLIGGVEASLRRVTHYDYWSDQLKPSILIDSEADFGVYGMGDLAIIELAKAIDQGQSLEIIKSIPQVFYAVEKNHTPTPHPAGDIRLADHETCLKDKKAYAANFRHIEQESNKHQAARLLQDSGEKTVVINPPYPTFSERQLDASFDLPYTRKPHPKYAKRGTIPAYEMIRHSVNMHRGCFGGCSFCTISAHQGKFVTSRSKESILKEVNQITQMDDFKGYISDLGGPSANMYQMKGKHQPICDSCKRPSCVFPNICSNLDTSHKPLLDIYQSVDKHPKVKKAFVSSGLRYDLFLTDDPEKNDALGYDEYMRQLFTRHVSGRLKVAPEHTSDEVLKTMRKPSFKLFYKLKEKFDQINIQTGLKQQLIPYFISSHPESRLEDMAQLAADTKALGFRLEQVQDFTPTPMTVATVMYYSGFDPYTLKPVFTARTKPEKTDQQKFFFWYKRENQSWIRQKLAQIGRNDLAQKLLAFDKNPKNDPKSKRKASR
ncbi:MAG: YgiQ family radical SAM protein [Bacteroidetes bacterium]|nr:YgiQ family radical SAM protein [Bacteroidota bacterium]MBU1580033.1 YgiQ family radical SAM protein [Bacteroidota bacterium]MBU2557893.1 YgiQ family radical SAM protein [Bacteroidota bacterium]